MQTLQSGTDLVADGWVESSDPKSGQTMEFPSLSRRRFIWVGLTAAATAAIGGGLWSQITHERFSTRIGELGHAELPDGSMAILNTDTEVELRFTHRARLVRLLKGEALFDVAPDSQRVLTVEAGRYEFEAPANSSRRSAQERSPDWFACGLCPGRRHSADPSNLPYVIRHAWLYFHSETQTGPGRRPRRS